MGLRSRTSKVKWNSFTKKDYINLGYIYTEMGDEFEIKVEDLLNGSHSLVEVKCDCLDCKNPYLEPMMWNNYLKYVRPDGKYYCKKCAVKLFAIEKRIKTTLEKGISFEKWCINNNRNDILNRWDYELNIKIPNEINHSTHKKYYFKCPIGIHESELKNINSFTSGQEGSMDCNQCNSFAQWGINNIGEDFLEKYWDYEKNEVSPWEISYSCNKPKVWIRCQNKNKLYHGSYDTVPSGFTGRDNRCPYCSYRDGKVHILDSLGTLFPQILELWSDKNDKSPYEYSPNNSQYIWLKCIKNKHKDYRVKTNDSNKCEFRCPKCSEESKESILQNKIKSYLTEIKYKILHEYDCNLIAQNPKVKNKRGRMPYDNEISIIKLIIECHGIQHYEVCGFHKLQAKHNNTTPEYELHIQQVRDRYKRIFAKKQGFFYLEIPYWTDDKSETWKRMIVETIETIR